MPIIYTIALGMFGLGWVFIRYLIQQDRGPKEPARALIAAGAFGLAAVGIAMFLESKCIPNSVFDHSSAVSTHELGRAALLVGVIEEAAKSLPLAVFLYTKRYFDEMTDGVIYFGIAGMVFGVAENIGYALAFGPAVGIVRIIVSPFIHAAFCALFGWTLAWIKVKRHIPFIAVAGALVAIGTHALYDFGLMYAQWWSSLLSLGLAGALNGGVFLLLRLAQRMDAGMGLAAAGNNLYCRSCGAPNLAHFMYCTNCGKRT